MFFKKNFKKSEIDAVIVGLGNPESKYDMTRHNIGFMVIDKLADNLQCTLLKKKFKAVYESTEIDGKKVLLVKPQTYMNNSGLAVREIMDFYKIGAEKLIVIADDISLDVGRLRIRSKGSHGGHNGLRSIIDNIGTSDFIRIKVGVGKKPNPEYDLADWVLSKFKDDEKENLQKAIDNSVKSAKMIINGDINSAMNKYNS